MNTNAVTGVFPGQGCQFVGMGRELLGKASDRIFAEASEVLGYDLRALCLDGPAEVLNRTEYSQPAIVTVSIAKFVESGIKPSFVAGHSLGEYTALCAAEVLSFGDMVYLVRERGRFMASSDRGRGGMAVLRGLTYEEAVSLCKEKGACIAAINADDEIVISGKKANVEAVLARVKQSGRKGTMLAISCAAHSPLMEEARQNMEKLLREIPFQDPVIPLVSNATGAVCRDGEEMKELVTRQLVEPVQWERVVATIVENGIEDIIEFSPKPTLVRLIEKIKAKLSSKQASG